MCRRQDLPGNPFEIRQLIPAVDSGDQGAGKFPFWKLFLRGERMEGRDQGEDGADGR